MTIESWNDAMFLTTIFSLSIKRALRLPNEIRLCHKQRIRLICCSITSSRSHQVVFFTFDQFKYVFFVINYIVFIRKMIMRMNKEILGERKLI